MKNLNFRFISGVIYAVLGIIGSYAVLFLSSPAVTWPFITIGAIAFVAMFAFGFSRALKSYFGGVADFQINN
jgi:ABC-type multidrug transport system fused ATPase/permease subunit